MDGQMCGMIISFPQALCFCFLEFIIIIIIIFVFIFIFNFPICSPIILGRKCLLNSCIFVH